MRSSATSPVAATTPPWRTPPPSIFLIHRALVGERRRPADETTIGAPSPCSGAPERCRRRRSARQAVPTGPGRVPQRAPSSDLQADVTCRRDQLACFSGWGERAAGTVVHVPGTTAWSSNTWYKQSPPGLSQHVDRHPAGPGAQSTASGMPPASQAALPDSFSSTCANFGAREPVAAAQVRRQRDDVAHGGARHPHHGIDAEQVRGPFLERAHRRISVEYVVADLGPRHGEPHSLIRFGDGVRT